MHMQFANPAVILEDICMLKSQTKWKKWTKIVVQLLQLWIFRLWRLVLAIDIQASK